MGWRIRQPNRRSGRLLPPGEGDQRRPQRDLRQGDGDSIRLLIATHNSGKLREFFQILSGGPFELTDLESEGISDDVTEIGHTFEENAVLKATAYRDLSGLATLADDSGLVVAVLGGRPGVRSSRYAGERATDDENVTKLLGEMLAVPASQRAARFQCVVAVAIPGREVATFAGSVEGTIAEKLRGEGGFGYDPVFALSDSLDGSRTMAQLSPLEKSKLSHRGMAAARAAAWLRSLAVEPEYN